MKYKYPFTNHIVFPLVMKNCQLCRGLLQLIFPDREIKNVRLHQDYVNIEQTIIAAIESHQVRLDVLFTDSTDWYDIEMQVRNEEDLPKRSRYSHAMIDTDLLHPGQPYNDLPPVYVIFLCGFDRFGKDKAVYRFSMLEEEENNLPLRDENYTIILNSKVSDKESVLKELRELFQYMNETIVAEDNELIKQIDESVATWNSGEGRHLMMKLEQEMQRRENMVREEGRQEGIVEERKKNEEQMREAIRKMKAERVPDEVIARCMNLSMNEIRSID